MNCILFSLLLKIEADELQLRFRHLPAQIQPMLCSFMRGKRSGGRIEASAS